MTRRIVILTGASRGLGLAMAGQLLAADTQLLTLSRHPADALQGQAAAAGAGLTQWAVDLAGAVALVDRLAGWLQRHAPTPGEPPPAVRLIHNAALLTPPGPADDLPAADLAAALRVGLEAPLVLSAAFLRVTRDWGGDRRLLFISSGLGRRAMAGSAAYCAIKAGMDHLARALALDEAAHAAGARVVSLAPGVIDTDMQRQLRGADPRRFSEQGRFAEMHRSGTLDSPATAAAKVLRKLERDDFGTEPIADVRD